MTVTNGLGTDTITMTNLVTVNAITPATLPYTQDFTGGLPAGGEWVFQSQGATGRIIAGTNGTASPDSGAPALIMDSSIDANYATNEAILFVDLASSNGGFLFYNFREMSDEADPEDGVFLSDGLTEILLQDHGNGPSTWTEFDIDLGAAAANAGMTLTSHMQIIFRQRDNYTAPTDGHQIDDVRVLLPPTPDTGNPNSPDAALTATGMVDKDGFTPTPSQNGPFFVTHSHGDQLQLQMQGPPGGFMMLLAGALNRNNVDFLSNGQLDIGMLGFNNYADIFVVIDGFNPVTLLDTFGALTPAGTQLLYLYLPSTLPVGNVLAFQALMSPNLKLTAAVELIIQ